MKPVVILVILAATAAAASGQDPVLYVSTDGKAEWSGKLAAPDVAGSDGPLATLEEARDAARRLRPQGSRAPIKVLVRGGTHYLSRPLVLEPEDSGITFAAYPGEKPVISGGRKVEGWVRAGKSLWTAKSMHSFRQLFVGGRRAQRARTPNYGFYRIDGPSSQDKPFLLKYRGNDIRKAWEGKDVEVIALLAWAEIRMPIAAVDETTRTARLAGDPRPSNRESDARYWIENAPDSLDAPGEWRMDAGSVFYWPLRGEEMSRAEIIAPALTRLVRLDGKPEEGKLVRDVAFRGLEFRHTDWATVPEGYADTQAAVDVVSAFEAVGAENIVIEHCRFLQMGGYAIWFGRGSKRNRVIANEISDMGAGGIRLGETTLRESPADRNSDNIVADNNIHNLGAVYPAAVGVWVGQSSRNSISHNHIHDLFYTAISVGWTWGYGPNGCKENLIEHNHLHHIGRHMLSDMGAIYTLGIQPGTVIRNNLIHDVYAFTYGGWGIYPDEGSSNIRIEDNIVYRTKSAGFHQHYGRENMVRNNIFAFGQEFQLMRTRAEPHLSFTFEQNIVLFDEGDLLGSNWTGEGFSMDRNLYWDARGGRMLFAGGTWKEWQQNGRDANSKIIDPMFENAGSYDFRLRPESPALQMGFRKIDMSRVGPRVPAGP